MAFHILEGNSPMEAVLQELDDRVVIAVKGRLDMITSREYEAACAPVCEGAGGGVVVDLRQLEYISSAGLRSLLVLAKAVKSAGGALVLCCLAPAVRDVMTISGFDNILPLAADRTAALQLLK